MAKRKRYEERTAVEKIQSQWHKLSGLHTREEWSAAIIRAATAAELATNFAIRQEFHSKSNLSPKFVDSLLKWANGIAGKVDHLLIHLSDGEKHYKTIKTLKTVSEQIGKKRNAIVHQGDSVTKERQKPQFSSPRNS